MLTVGDLARLPDLELPVVAGADGLGNAVSWLHVSELADPTRWLEGGEFLLTTGLGVGEAAATQRAYVRRLAKHGVAGLGFGIGFGFAEVPAPVVEAAEKLSFPVLAVPYEVPFVAITKTAFTHLANEQLEQLTRALEVHERLSDAVVNGRGVQALLAIVCGHLDCSLALVDERGRVVGERHARRRASFDGALELPVVGGRASRDAARRREGRPFGEYDRLVLHHGQTALAFELSRRRAVSAAELRLAGDLLEDLEARRGLDDRETGRRMAAFGLEPAGTTRRSSRCRDNGASGEGASAARSPQELDRRMRPVPLDRAAGPGRLPGRGGERGRTSSRSPRRSSRPTPTRGSASAGRRTGGRSGGACSRRAPRSTRRAATSPRTATSARSSSCSACPTRRSRRSSTAFSARRRRASG